MHQMAYVRDGSKKLQFFQYNTLMQQLDKNEMHFIELFRQFK